MPGSESERLLRFVKARGSVRASEVADAGFTRTLLYWLRDKGELIQVDRGLFTHPEAEIGSEHSLVEASKRVPEGIICLLSALTFHGLGTENPRAVWMAIPRGSRRPSGLNLPLRFVWFSGAAFTEGVEKHSREGIILRVYSSAKTVADLFKYRRKIGTSVAVEALKDGWERRLFTIDELTRFARICRVERIMRPYLQALSVG